MDSEKHQTVYFDGEKRPRYRSTPSSSSSTLESTQVVDNSDCSLDAAEPLRPQYSGYSTFGTPGPMCKVSSSKTKTPSQRFRSVAAYIPSCPGRSGSDPPFEKSSAGRSAINPTIWGVAAIVSVVIGILACISVNTNDYMLPEWKWDRNIYLPRNEEDELVKDRRLSLIAQVVSIRALKQLTDIASIPNRAYARQWGVDYTRFSSGRTTYSSKSCFDKVFVLNTLLDRQNRNTSESSLAIWPRTPRVAYDSIILLPPDSIVTDLDRNLFDFLLPDDKLVAIAGWIEDEAKMNSNSDIILFNMKHKHADTVAKLWWDLVQHPGVTCGANTDLGILVSAIESVLEEGENLDDLIEPVGETNDGFIGRRLIKCIPPSVPSSRSWLLLSSLQESKETLQGTADSVCYRFYPKCEVL